MMKSFIGPLVTKLFRAVKEYWQFILYTSVWSIDDPKTKVKLSELS